MVLLVQIGILFCMTFERLLQYISCFTTDWMAKKKSACPPPAQLSVPYSQTGFLQEENDTWGLGRRVRPSRVVGTVFISVYFTAISKSLSSVQFKEVHFVYPESAHNRFPS